MHQNSMGTIRDRLAPCPVALSPWETTCSRTDQTASTKPSSSRGKYQSNYNKYKQGGGNNYGNNNNNNGNRNDYGGGNNYNNKYKKARPAQEQKNASATGGSSN